MNAYSPPTRAQYEPNVLAFLPGTHGEELQLRAGLLLMRDRAMATKPAACEEAYQIMALIEGVVSREAFRPMPLDELRRVRFALLKLVGAAADFDAMWAPPLPELGLGELDARG